MTYPSQVDILKSPPCEVCGKESAGVLLVVLNNTEQVQNIQHCEQVIHYYCDEHYPNEEVIK